MNGNWTDDTRAVRAFESIVKTPPILDAVAHVAQAARSVSDGVQPRPSSLTSKHSLLAVCLSVIRTPAAPAACLSAFWDPALPAL